MILKKGLKIKCKNSESIFIIKNIIDGFIEFENIEMSNNNAILSTEDINKYYETFKQNIKRAKGGGRKPEYNEPTDTIAFRVPISHKDSIKRIVKEYLNKLKK